MSKSLRGELGRSGDKGCHQKASQQEELGNKLALSPSSISSCCLVSMTAGHDKEGTDKFIPRSPSCGQGRGKEEECKANLKPSLPNSLQ